MTPPLIMLMLATLVCGHAYRTGPFDKFNIPNGATKSSRVLGSEVFIPANDTAIRYVGRTRINSDGSRSFDWEAVAIIVSVSNSTYVKAKISCDATMSGRTKFVVDEPSSSLSAQNLSQGFSVTEFWVDPVAGAMSNDTYYAASGLDSTASYELRIFNALEPLFHGVDGPGYGSGVLTFHGLWLDGKAVQPPPPPTRALVWVGDSLTAGFGSRGVLPPCEVNQFSSSHYYSYSRYIGDALGAATTTIAWSGKGMFANCCDDGETMPAYFLQTLGSDSYTVDWDFQRETPPSALLINLGSNDMSKYNGSAAFITAFVDTFVQFALNTTRVSYRNPALPVLVVQSPFNDTLLGGALVTAVSQLNAAGADAHLLTAFPDGEPDGCQGHPGSTWHVEMADLLRPQIAAILHW